MTAALIIATWICMAWLSEQRRHRGRPHMIGTNQPRNGMSDHSHQTWWKCGNSALAVQLYGYYKWKCRCLIIRCREVQLTLFSCFLFLNMKNERWDNTQISTLRTLKTDVLSFGTFQPLKADQHLIPVSFCQVLLGCQDCRCTACLPTTGGPKRESSHLTLLLAH